MARPIVPASKEGGNHRANARRAVRELFPGQDRRELEQADAIARRTVAPGLQAQRVEIHHGPSAIGPPRHDPAQWYVGLASQAPVAAVTGMQRLGAPTASGSD